MAVLDGVEAYLIVNRQPMFELIDQEYATDAPDEIIRYVEAVSGESFQIYLRAPLYADVRDKLFQVRVYVDGNKVASSRHVPEVQQGKEFEVIVDSANQNIMGRETAHDLYFKDVIIEDNDYCDTPMDLVKNLGEIRVELWRHTNLKRVSTAGRRARTTVFNDFFSLSEKKLKGRSISHRVGRFHAPELTIPTAALEAEYIVPREPVQYEATPALTPRPGDFKQELKREPIDVYYDLEYDGFEITGAQPRVIIDLTAD